MSPIRRFLLAYAATAAVFLPLDATWLAATGPRLYRPALGELLAEQPDLAAALLFYALYFAGVVVFALPQAARAESSTRSALRAAFFGLVAYGTYDLTNQATLRHWPGWLTAIDLLWGASVTAVAAQAARAFLRRLQR
jgi:uncharacterized membrane protein